MQLYMVAALCLQFYGFLPLVLQKHAQLRHLHHRLLQVHIQPAKKAVAVAYYQGDMIYTLAIIVMARVVWAI